MFFHPQRLVCYGFSIMKKGWSFSSQKLVTNPASLEEGLACKEEESCAKPANPRNTYKPSSRLVNLLVGLNLIVCVTCTYYTITQAYLTKSEEIKLTNMLGELRSEISNVITEIDNIIDEVPAKTEDALKTNVLQASMQKEILEARKNHPNNEINLPVNVISVTDDKIVSENGVPMIEKHESKVTIDYDETTTPDPDLDASNTPEIRLYRPLEVISGFEPPFADRPLIKWPVESLESPKVTSDEMVKTDDDNIELYGLFWLMLQNAASRLPPTDKQTSDSDGSSTEPSSESLGDERQNDGTTLEQSVDVSKNENVEDESTVGSVNIEEGNASEDTDEQTTTAGSNSYVPDYDTLFDNEWMMNSDGSLSPMSEAAIMAFLGNYSAESEPLQVSTEYEAFDYPYMPDDWMVPSDYVYREQHKRSTDSQQPTNGNGGRNVPKGVLVVPLTKDKIFRRPHFAGLTWMPI